MRLAYGWSVRTHLFENKRLMSHDDLCPDRSDFPGRERWMRWTSLRINLKAPARNR